MYFMGRFFCSNVWIGVEFGVEIFRNREVCRNKKGAPKRSFVLSYLDSNQDRQNQKLQCYHYTIRQS